MKIARQLIGGFHAKGAYVAFWADVQLLQDQANLAKQKVSFVFCSTKDLQKMPLVEIKWVLLKCIGYFLKMKCKSTTLLLNNVFHAKASQSCKTRPKKRHTPFLHKILILTISMATENFINFMLPARCDAFASLFQQTSVPKFSMIFLESINGCD